MGATSPTGCGMGLITCCSLGCLRTRGGDTETHLPLAHLESRGQMVADLGALGSHPLQSEQPLFDLVPVGVPEAIVCRKKTSFF